MARRKLSYILCARAVTDACGPCQSGTVVIYERTHSLVRDGLAACGNGDPMSTLPEGDVCPLVPDPSEGLAACGNGKSVSIFWCHDATEDELAAMADGEIRGSADSPFLSAGFAAW